jgi:O-antigen/teichoic acid export membrane protein
MWLISYAVGCILPIDISSYNPENVTNIWIFVFSVLGVILFCVWMYYLTIYNNEDHFGKFSIWDDVKMLAVLMIGINLLML